MNPTVSSRLKNIALLVLIFLVFATLYTTLHEGGHALAGLAFGGRITAFNINFFDLSAHAGIDGTFTATQSAIINVAGVSLPLLAWFLLLLFLPRQGGFTIHWIKLIATLGTVNSLLAWVILPFLYLNGTVPVYDDVTKFIINSGLPPLAVAFGCLVLYALGWLLFALRLGDLRRTFNLQCESDMPLPGRRSLVVVLVLVAALVVGLAVADKIPEKQNPNLPPEGYMLAVSIPLNERDYQSETIYQYTAQTGHLVGVYVRATNINSPYIDVTLTGPDNISYPLLHGEGFYTSVSASQGNFELPDGEAYILLSSQASAGLLEIFILQP